MHIGNYIRKEILPNGMTVTAASKILKVSRPTLSKLLNGGAKLSDTMAKRLEVAFNVESAENLLKRQAKIKNIDNDHTSISANLSPYISNSLLKITSQEISNYFKNENLISRSEFPVFIRILVNNTKGCSTSEFPGYNNSEDKGWDGITICDKVNPFVPFGSSGWEFGVGEPLEKLRKDLISRKNEPNQKTMTFVFVSPHVIKNKEEVRQKYLKKYKWKDIKLVDGKDLEAWLETSLLGQIFMAEKIGKAILNIFSIHEKWEIWCNITEPQMKLEFFNENIESAKKCLHNWYEQNSVHAIEIQGNSILHTEAFIYAYLNQKEKSNFQILDMVVCVSSIDAIRALTSYYSGLIIIVEDQITIEYCVAKDLHKKVRLVYVSKTANYHKKPDIQLRRPSKFLFKQTLISMGFDEKKAIRLASKSGYTQTILRRLIKKPSIQDKYNWMQDEQKLKDIIPLLFVGRFNSNNEADVNAICDLYKIDDFSLIEEKLNDLLLIEEDCPIWKSGDIYGVRSKLDSLYLTRKLITKSKLDSFFNIANKILSEEDPALDLEKKYRAFAFIHGKTRKYSHLIRKSICETLCLISVEGKEILPSNYYIESKVDVLIKNLLHPISDQKWNSHYNDLDWYAEASPKSFLNTLKEDLNTENPSIVSIMFVEKDSFNLGGCDRTNLLYGLEKIAWNTHYLLDVVDVLCKLSKFELNDNYSNKPINSLMSILDCKYPQNSAVIDERIKLIQYVEQNYPKIAKEICLNQISGASAWRISNARPEWRNEDIGHGTNRLTSNEEELFLKKINSILFSDKVFDFSVIKEYLISFKHLDHPTKNQVLDEINNWSKLSSAKEISKVTVRDDLTELALPTINAGCNECQEIEKKILILIKTLKSSNPIFNYLNLFIKSYLRPPSNMLDNPEEWGKIIYGKRLSAAKEIYNQKGIQGCVKFISLIKAYFSFGTSLAEILSESDLEEFIFLTLNSVKSNNNMYLVFNGIMSKLNKNSTSFLIENVLKSSKIDNKAKITFLQSCPFTSYVWEIIRSCSKEIYLLYWKKIRPPFYIKNQNDLIVTIDKFFEVNRPEGLSELIEHEIDNIETRTILNYLNKLAEKSKELKKIELNHFRPKRILDAIVKRKDLSLQELLDIELKFMLSLEGDDYKFPILTKAVTEASGFFIDAISTLVPNETKLRKLSVDEKINLYRGIRTLKEILQNIWITYDYEKGNKDWKNLEEWVTNVRKESAGKGNLELCDEILGNMFSHYRSEDNEWSTIGARNIIETISSENFRYAIISGIRFPKGPMRISSLDSDYDKKDSEKYRAFSEKYKYEYPFVSSIMNELSEINLSEMKRKQSQVQLDLNL